MGRKGGPDNLKLKKIKSVLRSNRNGLWVREIARRAGLSRSTVSLYLDRYMANEIEEAFITNNQWIRIVKLK